MKAYNYNSGARSVKSVLVILALVFSLLAQPALPVFAYATRIPLTTESMPPASTKVEASDLLFRTRVTVRTLADWARLERLGVVVLETTANRQPPTTAVVLADEEQLEALARLRFEPQSTDELGMLVTAHAQTKPWLAASLRPLLSQAAAVQKLIEVEGVPSNEVLADLRAAMRTLTPEQKAGLAALSSIDDDADGLTNTEEQWWCTDPLNPNSDGDAQGYTDGEEVTALLDFTLPRSVRWGYGPPFGPPNAWPDWNGEDGDPNTPACNDGDYDMIPDYAEAYVVGSRVPEESTDRDKFDDGQELFGVTYCPGAPASCGYGAYPRIEYWNYIKATMPNWVRPPGDNLFVAAFPLPEVYVEPGSWTVERVTTITTEEGEILETTNSYETSVTRGQSTSIADTVTWNEWEEVSEAVETPLAALRLTTISSREVAVLGRNWKKIIGGAAQLVGGVAIAGGSALLGAALCAPGVTCPAGLAVGAAGGALGGAIAGKGWSDLTSPDEIQQQQDTNLYSITNINNNNVSASANANASITLNQNFDFQGVVNSLDGVQYAINQQGELLARGLYDISYAISQPRYTETRTNGHSWGGAQTTTHEEYEEHTIAQGEAFTSGQNWSTAWAVDSSHVAMLTFDYVIENTGTEYAREITGLIFNIYLGDDSDPLISYPAWEQFPGGKIENVFPGDKHNFASNPVSLTLEQMKRIDLGERLTVVLEDFSYGADELFYQDAVNGGVTLFIEDGVNDSDELVDSYVIPTWGVETVQDVIQRYFPTGEDVDGNLNSLWTPEFDGINPPTWNEHFLSDIAWWNIYLTQQDAGNTPLHELPAQAGSALLFRFNCDSDRDGYTDRIELQYGTEKDDPTSHPFPEMLAGYVAERQGDVVTVKLALQNSGGFDAFGVQAVMYAPDDTTTIGNNTVGGNGRVRAGNHVAVGSLVKKPGLGNWTNSTARPYSTGDYTSAQDKTYTFTVSTPGVVGQGSAAMSWDDGAGDSGPLDLGSAYHAPLPVDVGTEGLQVGFDTGTLLATESFTVTALTPRDTFTYTINSEPYTPPVIVVSYSDPQGSHRFITPVELDSLADDLSPYSGQMLEGVGLEMATAAPFDPERDNTTYFVFNSPHSQPIEDVHLYMNFVVSGTVVAELPFTTTLQPGPTVFPVTWSTSVFTEPYDADADYLVMGFWTDRQDNIIDTISRPLSSFQADPLAKAEVPTLHWDVGTLRWPESFSTLSSVIGTSHTEGDEGVVKQSPGYRLLGSAGQPAAGTPMISTNYSLVSGYWATVRARQDQLQASASAASGLSVTAAQSANDATERFPTDSFPIANIGWQALQLRAADVDDDITVSQVPSSTLSSGQYTELGVRLNTNDLGIGSFEKFVPIRTNDPTQSVIQLRITGDVEPASDAVFVYDYQNDVRPLNKIAHVNSVRDQGDVVRFQHGISGDVNTLHPLFLYAGDDTTLLGRGAAIESESPVLRQTVGDSASTDLTLADNTFDRRDYIVRYGYQADLTSGGGQHTYQVPLLNRNYGTVTLDILAHDPASNVMDLSLDVGGDGSQEWTFSGDVSATGGIVLADGDDLVDAINAYLDAQGGDEVTVPIRLTSDTQGTYFVTNLRGTLSTDYDLTPTDISVPDTPVETEVIQLCATVANDGQGTVPAAVVSFFAGDPDTDGLLIGHAVLTDLAAEGGQAEGCVDWDTTGYTGDLTLYAYADFWNQVVENNEDNNAVTTPVNVLSRPDLHVPTIELSDPEPVTGQPVTVWVTLRNGGQTAAGASALALYDGNPETGGTLLGEGTPAVGGESQTTLDFTWTPTAPGSHRLFAVSDRDEDVNEFDEGNNQSWQDVYVGFAGPLLLDSGTAGDVNYTAERGYGYVDEGQADIIATCGGGSLPEETLRRDPGGRVVYRFDHLLSGHFYHLDITLYECDGAGRQESIYVDGNLVAGPEDLGDGQVHLLSLRLDPALYTDHAIEVTIEAPGIDGAVVGQVNLHDVDYRYADAGGANDPAYPGDQDYGWLDGVSNTGWGTLPYQSVRVDQGDDELRYRFDGLDPTKSYQVHLTFWQPSGTARIQKVQIDGLDTGVTVNSGDYLRHEETVLVPITAYTDDGSIVVGIVRTNAASGAMVNEIALEEETLSIGGGCVAPATPFFTEVYGNVTVNGAPVPVGTVVQALSPRGDTVGCFTVETAGLYGFMRIYGEDTTANPPIPGMRDGETPAFRVSGAPAVPTPLFYWHDDKASHRVGLAAGPIEGQSILLNPGWNLFSLRVEPPAPLVAQVLASIPDGRYDRVLGETGIYVPDLPDVYNTLKELHCGEGYYLRLTGDTSVIAWVEGLPCAADTPIPLHRGWNWIGYLPEATLPITQALQSIEGHYQRVLSLDKTYDPALPEFSTLKEMRSDDGYLIYINDPVTLTYPAGGGGALAAQPSTVGVACDDVMPTPYLTLVYGHITVNGQPAPLGTRVDVLTPRGEVAGCFVVEQAGQYGLMHVYGADDTAEPPIPGFQEGEPLAFRVNGIPASASAALSWQDDKAPHQVDLEATIHSVYLPLIRKSP